MTTTRPQIYPPNVPTYHDALTASMAPAEPTRSVEPRAGALGDETVVRLSGDAAVKRNTFPSHPGYPSGMADLQTRLHVEAWVRNSSYAKNVWVDVHVFAHDGSLVNAETLPLSYTHAAGDGGDVFVLDAEVYHGSTATPGSVDPRPDARTVHYRLYAELEGQLFSDGVVHRCTLASDAVSR
jgi:hypothetical protein